MERATFHCWLILCGAVFHFAGAEPATAQAPGVTEQPPPAQASQAAPDYSGLPLVYESIRAEMRFENDGTGTREARGRVRVQTPAGLAKAGQLLFEYNAANERMEFRSVRVVKPDGKVVDAGPEAVQDLSAPVAMEAPMYTDARQKHVTVPAVAVGDVVEYDVLTTVFQPLMPGQFWQTYIFTTDPICLEEQVSVNVPRDRPLKYSSPPGVEPAMRVEGDRRIYSWSVKALHPPDIVLFRRISNSTSSRCSGAPIRLSTARSSLRHFSPGTKSPNGIRSSSAIAGCPRLKFAPRPTRS